MGPYASLGGMDGVGIQIGRQLAEVTAIASYSFVVSCIILYALKFIPGMHLRVSSEAEMLGLDLDQFVGETIGDWSMMEQHIYEANASSASSHVTSTVVPVKEV